MCCNHGNDIPLLVLPMCNRRLHKVWTSGVGIIGSILEFCLPQKGSILDRENSKGKGPVVGMCLASSKNSKEASGTGAEW